MADKTMTMAGAKALYNQPDNDVAGVVAKNNAIKEYNDAVQPSRTDTPAASVPSTSSVDKVNTGKAAKYGSKPGEKRPDQMDSYKKGGKVKKTGPAYMHKGEGVLTVKKRKKIKKQISGAQKVLSGL